MTTATLNTTDILEQIDGVVAELISVMASIDEKDVNTVPYQDSWTAGQLFRHVIMSTSGLVKAMQAKGDIADRDPGENAPKLKDIFLDFTSKMQSPEFIVPEEGPYNKTEIVKELGHTFQELKKNTKEANMSEVIKNTPLGDATKWEMIHFVYYHTQRHLHQLKKIYEALKNRE